jgi:tetratricopeptide (TPR) repeat protein
MMRPLVIACSALLIGFLQSPRASAQDAVPSTSLDQQLRAIGLHAQQAYEAKDFERARSLWLRAFALQPSADVALSLGRLDLELKRYRDSAEHLDVALRTLPDTTSEDTRALAKKALAEAKAQIAVVHATTNRAGADIRIDGKSAGRAPLVTSLYLEPGAHEISAHVESNSIKRPVVVEPGKEYQLSLPLLAPSRSLVSNRERAIATSQRDPTARSAPVAAPTTESSPSPAPLIIGGAVFVAGLASAVVFRLNSDAQYDKADQLHAKRATLGCENAQATSDECTALRAAAESGDRSRNWSTIGFGVAGAALVGTLTYWYWPWRGEKTPQTARAHLRFTPNLSEHVSGLVLSGEY